MASALGFTGEGTTRLRQGALQYWAITLFGGRVNPEDCSGLPGMKGLSPCGDSFWRLWASVMHVRAGGGARVKLRCMHGRSLCLVMSIRVCGVEPWFRDISSCSGAWHAPWPARARARPDLAKLRYELGHHSACEKGDSGRLLRSARGAGSGTFDAGPCAEMNWGCQADASVASPFFSSSGRR